ncbi:MAG TPA: hypothetical protein VEF89_04350 [Solirubrobacteraceae bacterium]|nr:hypothetical protein [Solirubrobacteraceae bacterium]
MTAIIILNVVFAAAVIVGIVGLLARSIHDDNPGATANFVRSTRRRRRTTARARVLGRTADSRA